MKKITFLLFCFIALYQVDAQDNSKSEEKKRKFTFTANMGANFALGAYRKKDSIPVHDSTHINGYADLGYYFSVSAGYQITDVIGVMAMLNGNFDDFNSVEYQSAYAYTTTNPLASPEMTASGNYFLIQYLIGPYFEIPCTKNKLSKICIKLLAGSMHCNYPTLSVLTPNYFTLTQTVQSGSGFSYCINVGYEQYASETVSILYSIGYSGGSITYPSVTITESGQGGNYSYKSNSPRAMSVGLIQLATGVVIHI